MLLRLTDIVPELGPRPEPPRAPVAFARRSDRNAAAQTAMASAEHAAFERGRKEGLVEAAAESEHQRAEQEARLASAVAAARQAATHELAQATAAQIDASLRDLEARLTARVLDVLEPILAARLEVEARRAFTSAVTRAVSIGPAVKVRLGGPADIVGALSQALDDAGIAHATAISSATEVTADVDDLRIRASLDALSTEVRELVA